MNKRSKRKLIRWSIISGNVMLLLIVALFVLVNRTASQTIRSSTLGGATATASSLSSPLDQLSSEQIALQAAQMAKMPELTMVRNRADSATAVLASAANDSTILAKPQVVSTAQKSRRDIITYTSQPNDSVTSLAVKFGVSANAIKWSNGLNTDAIKPGTKLVIPPAEGIVYMVKAGDTADSLVTRYQANKDTLITVNDAEGGLPVGQYIWIPNAIQPITTVRGLSISSLPSTGAHRYGSCSLGVNNGYFCGWCTWWAAYRRAQIGHPVPSNLGDAYTWGLGLPQSHKPSAGAVLWLPRVNHVGFVESVGADGSVYVSEMNHQGWDVVSYKTIPADQASSWTYLY